MAEGMNKVILLGNVGKDPELRTTQGGTAVLKFGLACNERRKGKDGEWGDHVEWVNVVVWGKRYSTEVHADNVLLCGSKRDGGQQSSAPRGGGSHTTQTEDEFNDADCPF